MTKEEKINIALAFLSPLLFEGEAKETSNTVQITFSSDGKIEYNDPFGIGITRSENFNGQNLLADVLDKIVSYNIAEERKHWERCVYENCEETEFQEINGDIRYDPQLEIGHIYHSIQLCALLIEQNPDE